MVRQIKFRCWFASKMWYGIPAIYFDENGVRRVDLNHEDDDRCVSPDTWTGADDYVLMQYTGLTDSNGREVYEGDIVRTHFYVITGPMSLLGEVEIHPDATRIHFPKHGSSISVAQVLDDVAEPLEVVGNIHENPELLD